MANPPITIGPFTNTPAPGSPIKSDWAQQTATVLTKAAWGPAGIGRVTKPSDQGGFANTELALLTLTVPAASVGRLTNLAFGWTLTATTQPGAVASIITRVRQTDVAGAVLTGWVHYWQPGSAASTLPNVSGMYPLLGLAAGTIALTFQASAGTYTIGAGSYFAGWDAGKTSA